MQYSINDHSLLLPIEVFGVAEELKRPITGNIDTGFSGYLSLPFVLAFPIGLVLKGQQPYTMADGTVANHLVCLGTVVYQGKSAVMPIDISPSGPVLIGVQLLKKLDLELNVQFSKEVFDVTSRRGR